MCGICGFTKAAEAEADFATLQRMCDVMAHRGPDGEGRIIQSGVALGHRRLSLIDLEGGAQPLVRDEDGTRWSIVFNGEIYNYRELRAELETLGYSFATNSDTEVLLVGYIAWGAEVLSRLRGMFAFAIHDTRTRELFCARDFFGIKPFYYTMQRGQFIFASEIKSILEHPAYERQLNEEALAQYLCFQFSALPETFFKGVFKLLPGHYLRVRDDAPLQCVRYWRPDFRPDASRSAEETVDLIEAAMRESVRYHNVADVEVGSFLSSGIDSSYLAACLARENPDIKTFTVGFAEYESERDEVSWARELAGRLNVENDAHHITEDEYWESLPRVQWHMDEPSGDPSAVALYFVDKLAACRVKAVLSGEGADEFFGGYRIYQTPFANERVSKVPKGVLRAGSKVLHAMGQRGANYLERASEQVEEWYYTNANGVAFTPAERDRLLAPALRDRLGSLPTPQQLTAAAYAEAAGLDDTTRMQHVDMQFWLVGDILLKTDKMAMAHSLESRVPFLDREVFALASTIPTSQKVTERQTKVTLREAAERAIPRDWAQKEKLGFPVPVVSWLREGRCFNEVKRAFESDVAARFFDVDELRRLLDEHRAGADRSRRIWIVYSFIIWYCVFFIDGMPARGQGRP
ncbi:MAG TPA: asparagine synthase (glutamine-hydrolyzing) [Eggerthellaceae bacterium]|nr:asparagine synthase (glutamine-hydrolyzing) [Eggerthellaceae bacterium]